MVPGTEGQLVPRAKWYLVPRAPNSNASDVQVGGSLAQVGRYVLAATRFCSKLWIGFRQRLWHHSASAISEGGAFCPGATPGPVASDQGPGAFNPSVCGGAMALQIMLDWRRSQGRRLIVRLVLSLFGLRA